MDAERRRVAIARLISENDGADIKTLAEHFHVSAMTIRRDRKILSARNKIEPTHGGAVPVGYRLGEMPYARKTAVNLDKKQAIARAAAELVPDECCVILDAGTTTLELAKLLFDKRISVVTVDMRIALLLAQSPTVTVFTPGGEVHPELQCQIDAHALNYLNGINASLSFIGSAVWDAGKGMSSSSVAKQAIKRAMMKRAERTLLLADSSKYSLCNPWHVAELSAFSAIISDEGLSRENRCAVEHAGGTLTIAGLDTPTPTDQP
ncbi:MAG: DeoR/GlpR family DNA-binding transcription regulator [Methylobacteriaceae bacterium]|jgi:DeoR family fructose operon transcriptional repressor|nr:DeoR/GlpR family DNA-binding transcription regulator [Methylobacteriaceae bacterium]